MSKKQSTGSVTSEQEAPENGEEEKEVIVQYIIVRNDVQALPSQKHQRISKRWR